MFGYFARSYGRGRVATPARRTHAQGWRMWVSWKIMKGKGNWLGKDVDERGLVVELTEEIAYRCAEKNKGSRPWQ